MIDRKYLYNIVRSSRVSASSARPVHGTVTKGLRRVEAFRGQHDRGNKRLVISASHFDANIDISWLKPASATFGVSDDPRDYVLIEVPGVTIDIPNRNSQAFPLEEVTYYDNLLHRVVYQTFTGSMTAMNHDNKDPLKARGVIFDSALRYVPEYDVWKIVTLTGWCRQKDPWLAEQIATGKRNLFSLGALVSTFVCSYCGNIETDTQKCRCMREFGKGAVLNGHLIYQVCTGANFIEMSSVDDPADVTAEGKLV